MTEVILEQPSEEATAIDLYQLPNAWAWADVATAGAFCKNAIVDGPFGSNLKISDYVEDGPVPVLTTRNLDGTLDGVRYISKGKFHELERSAVRPNDILIAKIGSCGKVGIYPPGGPVAIIPANLLKVSVNRYFALKYVYYFFLSSFFQKGLRTIIKATAQPAFGVTNFKRLPMPVAPEREQCLIVAEIEKQFIRLDAATAALKRVQANLKRYRTSVLKAACEGRLVPTEAELAGKEARDYEPADKLLQRILRERRARWEADTLVKMTAAGKRPTDDRWKLRYKEPMRPDITDLPGLPEGWCWASADQITSLITDGEHITPERVTSGVYLLSARNVRDGRLSFDEVDYISKETHARLSLRLSIVAGDVLLSCSGSVGRSCVVPVGVEFSLVRSVAVLKPVLVDSEYLCSAIRSGFIQDQIRRKSTQT